jgi:hypothetical protein
MSWRREEYFFNQGVTINAHFGFAIQSTDRSIVNSQFQHLLTLISIVDFIRGSLMKSCANPLNYFYWTSLMNF